MAGLSTRSWVKVSRKVSGSRCEAAFQVRVVQANCPASGRRTGFARQDEPSGGPAAMRVAQSDDWPPVARQKPDPKPRPNDGTSRTES